MTGLAGGVGCCAGDTVSPSSFTGRQRVIIGGGRQPKSMQFHAKDTDEL